MPDQSRPTQRGVTPIASRLLQGSTGQLLAGVSRVNVVAQVVAGVALVAIAIPEQIATAQLAGVASSSTIVAFILATFVFLVFGSHPVLSIGADSTIAPLFLAALTRLALSQSSQYFAVVAATAVVTGLLIAIVGWLQWGWLADFLSLPIVTGFMSGIGIVIIVHQLPRLFGVTAGGESVVARLNAWMHAVGHTSVWSLGVGVATIVVMAVGEKCNARWPWALAAVVGGSLITVALGLGPHGVTTIGRVHVGFVVWRLGALHWSDAQVIVTTAFTLVIVIMSQSAATARTTSDELGVADNVSRDFIGIGLANVVAGLAGTLPVNVSPARTGVAVMAGGRTKLTGLVAAAVALATLPALSLAHYVPLTSLAGVLVFVAARLIKVSQWRAIARFSRVEILLCLVATVGVVGWGVETGLGVAVALAIVDQTWRSSRPRMVELGRRTGTTSWEPMSVPQVEAVDHVVAVFFDHDLFFANASQFRRELHEVLRGHRDARHVVIDSVAMAEVDFTGLTMLTHVVQDLQRDGITLTFARASERLRQALSSEPGLVAITFHHSVNSAVEHAMAN